MNVIRTISAPERRSLKRLSTKAATPAVRAQVLAVTDEEVPEDTYDPVNWQPGDLITAKRLNQTDAGVDKNAEEIVKIKSDKPTAIQTNLIDNLLGIRNKWLI